MKKISSKFLPAVIATLAALFSGCTSFDYVGQTFPETPYSVPIPMYMGKETVPPGVYSIIGRGVLTSRHSMDNYDLEEALSEEARARGADAYCVLGVKVERVGSFGREDDRFMMPIASADSIASATNPDGSPLEVNSFGDETNVDFGPTVDMRQVNYRKEYLVRVLFLKNRAQLEAILQERDARSTRERRTVDLPPGPAAPAVNSAEPKKSADANIPVQPVKTRKDESSEPGNVEPKKTPDTPAKAIPASPETPPAPQK